MVSIESKNNTLFKDTKKLKERRNRVKASKFIIEGIRLVEEAIKANVNIEYIFIENKNIQRFNEFLDSFSDLEKKKCIASIKLYEISENLNKELSSTETPQGIIAVINTKLNKFKDNGSFYIVCDKVQDPGNLGTIIRTAHACGADGIIMTKGSVDIYNEKVLRSTMGSVFYVPIIYDDDVYSVINSFKDKGFKIVSTSLQAENNFYDEDLTGNVLLVVGNEGNGVSEYLYSISNVKVKIPMPGGAESLNVSVASSVIMYEKLRQSSR